MENKKLLFVGLCLLAIVAGVLTGIIREKTNQAGAPTSIQNARSFSHASSTCSTTASQVVSANSGRLKLILTNLGTASTSIWAISTSTGVVANSGMTLFGNGSTLELLAGNDPDIGHEFWCRTAAGSVQLTTFQAFSYP